MNPSFLPRAPYHILLIKSQSLEALPNFTPFFPLLSYRGEEKPKKNNGPKMKSPRTLEGNLLKPACPDTDDNMGRDEKKKAFACGLLPMPFFDILHSNTSYFSRSVNFLFPFSIRVSARSPSGQIRILLGRSLFDVFRYG